MKEPKDIQYLDINEVKGLVTNVDPTEESENYAPEIRGFRNLRSGMVLEPDFGTKHRYATNKYPTAPSAMTIVPGGLCSFYDTVALADVEIFCAIDTSNYFHVFGIAEDTVTELTEVFRATVNDTSITATDTDILLDAGTSTNFLDSLGGTHNTVGASYLAGWVCYNVTRSNFAYVSDNDANSVGKVKVSFVDTTNGGNGSTMIGSNGLAWQTGDQVILIRNTGWMDALFSSLAWTIAGVNLSLNTTPHVRFNVIEERQKVNLYYGSSAATPVMQVPLRIQKVAGASRWYTGSAYIYKQYPLSVWTMERGGGGLVPNSTRYGTPATGILPASFANQVNTVTDATGFMKVDATPVNTGVSGTAAIRALFTLVYDDYQESDPVYAMYLGSPSSPGSVALQLNNIQFSLPTMNRAITSVRMYVASADWAKYNAGWAETTADYKLAFDFVFDATTFTDYTGLFAAAGTTTATYATAGTNYVGWTNVTTNQYNLKLKLQQGASAFATLTSAEITACTTNGAPSMATELGHAISFSRAYLSSRFAVRTQTSNGGMTVVDRDDRTLNVCLLDGLGAIEDDNFVDDTTTDSGFQQLVNIFGDGQLMGLSVMFESIIALRRDGVEIVDLQSGAYRFIRGDFLAKLSIVKTPYGLVFAGNSGIYLLPIGGGDIQLLNEEWQNLYDGRMRTDDFSVQRVTDANRALAIGGYNYFTDELIMQVPTANITSNSVEQIAYIYSFTGKRWRERLFTNLTGGATLEGFATRSDKTFTLANATYLYQYPNLSSSTLLYEEAVSSAGVTASAAVPRSLMVVCGNLYNIETAGVPYDVKVALNGTSSNGTTNYTLGLYKEFETTAFQSITIPVDNLGYKRKIHPVGRIRRLRFRIDIAANVNTRRFDVYKIVFGFVKRHFIGNHS